MIGQYLSNTNESATVSISQNFLELDKALERSEPGARNRPAGREEHRAGARFCR